MTDLPRTLDRSCYRQWHREPVRFGDIDVNAHVNNAAFLNIVQSPRVVFLRGLLAQASDPGTWIVGHVGIDYLRSVEFPAELEIGTGIERLGKTSVVVVQGVFDASRCAATVRSTMVHLADKGGQSAPIQGKLRELLSSQLIHPTSGTPSG